MQQRSRSGNSCEAIETSSLVHDEMRVQVVPAEIAPVLAVGRARREDLQRLIVHERQGEAAATIRGDGGDRDRKDRPEPLVDELVKTTLPDLVPPPSGAFRSITPGFEDVVSTEHDLFPAHEPERALEPPVPLPAAMTT